MELVWNVVTVIINLWFTASITFYDVFCGLRVGHGMGNASLEAKLIQKVTAMK